MLGNAQPSNINDGNDDTYIWFGLGEDPVSWTSITIDLETIHTVTAVRLKMSGKTIASAGNNIATCDGSQYRDSMITCTHGQIFRAPGAQHF